MNASTSPLHQALTAAANDAAARLPNVKAPVDLEAMVLKALSYRRAHIPRGGRAEYFDDEPEPAFEPIRAEIERLQCAEYDRDQVMGTTTGVLLVLSRLRGVIAAMGPEAQEAVERFSKAVAEAQA